MQRRVAVVLLWIGAHASALGATFDASVTALRVSANGNEIVRVQSEIGYIASRVLTDASGLELNIVETVPDDPVIKLKLSGDLNQDQAQRILQAAKRYVRLRLEGHSQQFATFLAFHGKQPWPKDLHKMTESVPELRDDIAFPWVRQEVSASLAFPLLRETEKHRVLHVIDGDLAWVYIIPIKAAKYNDVIKWRFDAIEFSPAAHGVIHGVYEDLKREGGVPTPQKSPGAAWWYEFKKRLEEKAGLHWRTPLELNPYTRFS